MEQNKQNNQNGAQQNVAPGEKAAAMLSANTSKTNATGKGALVVFDNQPPMGDITTLMYYFMKLSAIDEGRPTAYFSQGQTNVAVCNHLIGIITGIDQQRIDNATLTDDDWKLMDERLPLLTVAPLYLDDTEALTLDDAERKIATLAKDHGVELVIIDNLRQTTTDGLVFTNEESRLGYIDDRLKTLAEGLHIVIFAIQTQ